jgi:phosphatidylinositol 4-kinase
MGIGVPMPCFKNGSLSLNEILVQFKERFMLNCTQETAVERIDALIEKAAFNWRTKQYDIFQKLTNDILP